jgi:alkylation response protein AidB-like acyl-CoA dehydrogenase
MVHFALTDEQRALQSSVRRYTVERFPLSAVHALFDDPDGDGDPADLWKAVGEQGWLAGLVPERFDGLGLQLLDAAVIARCWGEAVMPGPLQATIVTAEAIRLAGSEEQQAQWLSRVAAGQARLSFAVRGEGGAWSPDGVAVVADFGAARATLTGSAVRVEYAHVADQLVVAARDGSQTSLWLVDPSAEGVSIMRHDGLDRSTRLCTVTFDHAHGELLSADAADILVAVLDRAAVLYANDLAGIARQALTRTVDYLKVREQFGRPVGSFQALKHVLADLHVAVTMAEHAAYYAAHALEQPLPDAKLAVSVAKAKANTAARDATAVMIQFHGGIGYTWEHDAHLFFKRAKRAEYQYGDTATHLERVASVLIDSAP